MKRKAEQPQEMSEQKTVKFSEDTKDNTEVTPSVAFPHMIVHA